MSIVHSVGIGEFIRISGLYTHHFHLGKHDDSPIRDGGNAAMNHIAKHILAATVFTGLLHAAPGAAVAQERGGEYTDTSTGLRFPDKLSRLRYERVMDFGNSELGYCVIYREPEALGQICVYDLGYKNVPPGVDSAAFKAALKAAEDGMLASISKPPYQHAELFANGTPSIAGGDKVAKAEARFFSSELPVEGQAPIRNTHLILMTSGLGKFVKLIYTMRNAQSPDFAQETKQIVEDFVRFNGPLMEKFLVETKE